MEGNDIHRMREEYLERHIYEGIADLNAGFDVPSIKYFSKEDFAIHFDRVEAARIGKYGIEPLIYGDF